VLLAACLLAAPAAAAERGSAELAALRIDEANAPELLLGGPDAIGGVGDWYLANDLVEVIVDDPSRRHGKLNHGGVLVDAGVRGRRGADQLAQLFPIVNLDQRVLLNYDTLRAEVDPQGRFARLVVSGGLSSLPRGGALARRFDLLVPASERLSAVRAETEYRVEPGEPFVRVTTRLRNGGSEPAPVFAYGDVWMRGGRSLRCFVGNTLAPERSTGFSHRGFDRSDMLGSGDAMTAFSFVAAAGVPGFPPITYALFAPERAARGLPFFGVTGEHVNFVNAFTFDPPWEKVGLWGVLRATRHELAPGAEWSFERRLLVVAGGDVAAATDSIFAALGVADGSSGVALHVEPPGLRAVIHVRDAASGAPVTQLATPRPDGADWARAALPPGDYRLELRAEQRPPQELALRVEPGRTAQVTARFDGVGALRLAPAFADGGPGRIVFEGLGGTADPVFGAELLGFQVDGRAPDSASEARELHFAGGAGDPERVELAPGRYRLTATRGFEHEIAQREVEISGPGAEVALEPFELRRAVALRGIAVADLHVHGQASDDSQMPNEARLRSFAAELVQVMVSSDHDHVGNFSAALDALDLGGRLRVRTGVEVTSSAPSAAAPWTIGHHNAWPVAWRATAHRHGAPPSQDLSVAELYARLRADYGAQVVQMNHALDGNGEVDDGAFLSHLGTAGEPFDPSQPLEAWPNRLLLEPASDGRTRALDFDAMEIMNGDSWRQYLALREAWYALLRQGIRRTGTGNSDTHGPGQLAGYPRNYVYVGEGEWDDAAFDAAVREGRLFATTGPLIAAFRVGEGRMGDLVPARDGAVQVELAVAAPAWVPVDEVRLLANGELLRRWTQLAQPEAVMRLRTSERVPLAADSFFTVEAGAALDADPERWRRERGGVYASQVAPGFVSQAISNPIFVDADGDGRFTPPGLGAGAGRAERRLFVTLGLVALLALCWWWLRRRAGLAR
jgi:hypothetical protein